MDLFDRNKMTHYPLNERSGNVAIADACICEDAWDSPISPMIEEKTKQIANEIILARRKGASVICAFGAHAIKNGLGRLMGQMLLNGWFSHTASNGTAVIHDWEFAFNGKSGEDAHATKETGLYINLALAVGAYQGLGYGASVGNMIRNNGLRIPQREELLDRGETFLGGSRNSGSMNAVLTAFDLYELIETLNIPSGFLSIPHPYSDYSLLAAERRAEHSFTCHPMFGHDIVYTHTANRGAVIGRTAEKDFLEYVSSVAAIEGGVYISVGSAVMSPMIFEKAMSMARNAAGGKDAIKDFSIHVIDIQDSSHLKFMKTFNRMGCNVDYTCADNRDFFVSLYRSMKMAS